MDGAEIDDVIMGAAIQQGSTHMNTARQCASGLIAIATAAKQIISDGMMVTVGGRLEAISLCQNEKMNLYRAADP